MLTPRTKRPQSLMALENSPARVIPKAEREVLREAPQALQACAGHWPPRRLLLPVAVMLRGSRFALPSKAK